MKTVFQEETKSSRKISGFAKRSYEIYLKHYKSRNMTPTLTLDEFMKNYSTS